MKVLIADDNTTTRRLLELLLMRWGFETICVSNGEKALQVMEQPDPPSIALLDWIMPGMDGLEICRRLRRRDSDTSPYILIVTGKNAKEDIVEGLEAGADDYIVKPVDAHELRARINVGVRIIKLQRALAERVRELEEEKKHVKTLQGLIPICMHCHRIRDDAEIWQRLETYIEKHSSAAFSHSLCPECLEKYYPEQPQEENELEEDTHAASSESS